MLIGKLKLRGCTKIDVSCACIKFKALKPQVHSYTFWHSLATVKGIRFQHKCVDDINGSDTCMEDRRNLNHALESPFAPPFLRRNNFALAQLKTQKQVVFPPQSTRAI